MKNLIECRLTKKQLGILNDTFCVYKNGIKTGEVPVDCDECILRDIEWKPTEWHERDLCFAIHHNNVLEQ